MKRSRTGLLIASAATVGTLFVVPVAQSQPGVTSVDSAEKPAPSKGTQPGATTSPREADTSDISQSSSTFNTDLSKKALPEVQAWREQGGV